MSTGASTTSVTPSRAPPEARPRGGVQGGGLQEGYQCGFFCDRRGMGSHHTLIPGESVLRKKMSPVFHLGFTFVFICGSFSPNPIYLIFKAQQPNI